MLNQINYILLDAARMGDTIEKAKEINPDFDSLYRGRTEETLAVVAPYLFLFRQNSDFGNWYVENGWGKSWGILIRSHLPMPELHKHFRKFLIVGTEDQQELYFRFYDPRVLRVFLPTCDQQQLRAFFGPIEFFIMEDADQDWAIRCWLENGHLRSVKIPLPELINNTFKFSGKAKTSIEPESDKNAETNIPQTRPSTRPVEKDEKNTNPDPEKKGSKWNNFFFEE